jgi:hypothetical protein
MVEAFYMQSVLGGREFSVMSHPKKRWVILCNAFTLSSQLHTTLMQLKQKKVQWSRWNWIIDELKS